MGDDKQLFRDTFSEYPWPVKDLRSLTRQKGIELLVVNKAKRVADYDLGSEGPLFESEELAIYRTKTL